ncbi:MAG: DNA helicase II [Acidiferrobacteraceae bacterium]|nr:DNA helicase II [Acidiferrobacteraceae bacterium]
MELTHIFGELNKVQREAVASEPGPLLILAGAGSGKTRVLTYRIAWLIEALSISPLSILAVTFTNKAALEMRHRIESILGFNIRGMWIGTFHSLSHRILRAHHQEANLPEAFEILDADDQYRLIRRILKELQLNEEHWQPRQIQWFINNKKEEGIRSIHLKNDNENMDHTLLRIYEHYENLCQRFGLVDFSELLLRTHELFSNNQDVLKNYRTRFSYTLVDEFQDTNKIQYQWLKIITEPRNHIFAVGDDDQSIYGWRGARIENMTNFQYDFPETQIIRLEQNYRSTGNILQAANAVIDHNKGRLGKNLWTEDGDGDPIKVYAAYNDLDEGKFVLDTIHTWIADGHRRDSIAILYRSNAQSRIFEELLFDSGTPYRVYGGLRFFERAEVKDVLAYLRLIHNRNSDPAFERIVNVPPRGIGNRTLETLRDHSRKTNHSLWNSVIDLLSIDDTPMRIRTRLQAFVDLIDSIDKQIASLELHEQTSIVIDRSRLVPHYQKIGGEKALTRIENIEELVNAAKNFNSEPDADGVINPLEDFLANAALEAGESQAEAWQDCVQLMSLHSAKGLEFKLVFLCGVEEGLFPHQRSIQESGGLEEERRLCYVGMTRAMQQLFITWAEIRYLHGRENYSKPSRFLLEIPEKLIHNIRSINMQPDARIDRSAATDAITENDEIQLGSRVVHKSFGAGTVITIEGQGASARVQVNFEDAGNKWLVLSYANLNPE